MSRAMVCVHNWKSLNEMNAWGRLQAKVDQYGLYQSIDFWLWKFVGTTIYLEMLFKWKGLVYMLKTWYTIMS
jgi:hypothetical protein